MIGPSDYENISDLHWDLLRMDGRELESIEFESSSGTVYTGQQIFDRIEEELDLMKNGDGVVSNGIRPVPRVENENGDRWIRELVDQEWYDLLTEKDRYASAGSNTFKQFFPDDNSVSPHQGWKLRVTAYPEEAREVAEAALPYLQEEDISHKAVKDFKTLDRLSSGQEGKFITIYPEIDDDRVNQIMQDGSQVFGQNPYWNSYSINSNTQNAAEIVGDLERILEQSNVDLYEGPSIDGHNGEEKQYGNTRIHFRYAHHFNTPAVIKNSDGELLTQVGKHEGLVDKNGNIIEGSYIGDEIDAVQYPIPQE